MYGENFLVSPGSLTLESEKVADASAPGRLPYKDLSTTSRPLSFLSLSFYSLEIYSTIISDFCAEMGTWGERVSQIPIKSGPSFSLFWSTSLSCSITPQRRKTHTNFYIFPYRVMILYADQTNCVYRCDRFFLFFFKLIILIHIFWFAKEYYIYKREVRHCSSYYGTVFSHCRENLSLFDLACTDSYQQYLNRRYAKKNLSPVHENMFTQKKLSSFAINN